MADMKSEAAAPDSTDTHERILLTAERLFADRGFDGVSVRDIVAAANVNLAAINYHFGSKSALLMEIFRKRAKELNKERLRRLRDAEACEQPKLEDILRALLASPILWRDPASGREVASRFMARALAEVTPDLRTVLETDVSHQRGFVAALARLLPDWRESELCWALHFASGLAHQCTDTNFKRIEALSYGDCDTHDLPAILERAVRFAAGGILAMGDDLQAKVEPKPS
jgi:AcrR family transcriptional regulator